MQVAQAQRHADGILSENLARRTNHRSQLFQTARCERYICGDRNIEGPNVLDDPIIGRIGACRYDDVTDSRIRARSYSTVGDDVDNKAVTIRDAFDLGFDRACIAIDKDIEQRFTPVRIYTAKFQSTMAGLDPAIQSARSAGCMNRQLCA